MRYPYFINPDIDALSAATGEERLKLIRHIAACVGNPRALRTLLGIDPEEFRRFYPDMTPPELSTEDTITTFIDRFAPNQSNDTKEVERIIAAPVIDYAATLEDEDSIDEEAETNGPSDSTSDAISAFLQAVPPKMPSNHNKPAKKTDDIPNVEKTENSSGSDSDLQMGLFKLMVKNKNYSKALEIINEISLNNPKKSIYFAYQMRFLQKLIKNQSGQADLLD